MPQLDQLRLHLDEHISPRVASQLRKYGFDATSSHEAALLSLSDEAQLDHAVSERRAIVTFNVVDFMALHDERLAKGAITPGSSFRPKSRSAPCFIDCSGF